LSVAKTLQDATKFTYQYARPDLSKV